MVRAIVAAAAAATLASVVAAQQQQNIGFKPLTLSEASYTF